jgi:hypothetical protein
VSGGRIIEGVFQQGAQGKWTLFYVLAAEGVDGVFHDTNIIFLLLGGWFSSLRKGAGGSNLQPASGSFASLRIQRIPALPKNRQLVLMQCIMNFSSHLHGRDVTKV